MFTFRYEFHNYTYITSPQLNVTFGLISAFFVTNTVYYTQMLTKSSAWVLFSNSDFLL